MSGIEKFDLYSTDELIDRLPDQCRRCAYAHFLLDLPQFIDLRADYPIDTTEAISDLCPEDELLERYEQIPSTICPYAALVRAARQD